MEIADDMLQIVEMDAVLFGPRLLFFCARDKTKTGPREKGRIEDSR